MFSSLLLIVIYLSFISLGLPDSVLGAAWPMMHQDLGVSISFAGLLSMTTCFGTIISSLSFSFISRRFKTSTISAFSTALTALALFLYSRLTNFYAYFPVAFILGLGAGSIDSALNNYVSLHYKAKQMSFLHASWGLGTTVGPFLLAFAFSHNLSWRFGYIVISSVQAVIALLIVLSTPIWRQGRSKDEIAEDEKSTLSYKEALAKKGAIFALLGFFSYCAMENSAMLWSSAYAVSRGLSEAKAASSAGMLFWGITIGRILTGFFADRLGDKKMIRIGLAIMSAATIMLLSISNSLLALALFLLGFGFGPLYPSMLHQTPYLYGRSASATLIGLEMASAYVGSTFMPSLFGLISSKLGLGFLPLFLIVFLIMIVISTELKRGKRA